VDLLPLVKKRLRGFAPGQAAMAVGLLASLVILVWPQNRGSTWQSVSGLAFSPDSKQLAIGVYSGRLRSLRERWYLADLYHTVALAQSNDLEDATVLGRASRPDVFNILPEVLIGPSVTFSADGSVLMSAGFNGSLDFWDTAARRRISTQTSEKLHYRTLASLRPDDRYAAAMRHEIFAGSFADGSPPHAIEVGVNILALAPSPDGSRVAIGGLGSLEIEVWDTVSRRRLVRIEPPEGPDLGDLPPNITSIAWLPDGKSVVAANDKTVEITDLASRKVTAVLPERLVLALAISPDGKQLATGRFDGVTIWDLPARTKTAIHLAVPAVESLKFSPDGSRLAAGSVDGAVRTWNLPNYNLAASWTCPRPNDAGLAQFLKVFPLLVWIGVWIYLWRARRAVLSQPLLRV
jgi:WD40 repeat protein